jgi:hypothetical protein
MAHLISQALAQNTDEGQTDEEVAAAAAAGAAGVSNNSCDLLKVLQRSDLFVYISTYLDNKSLRSLCNSSVRLKEEKKLYLYWTCTSSFSTEYVESDALRSRLLQKVSCPKRQIFIRYFSALDTVHCTHTDYILLPLSIGCVCSGHCAHIDCK